MNLGKKWQIIMALSIVGLALYANTFNNHMFWDDDDIILNNHFVHNFEFSKFFTENQIAGANLISNYWRPMMLTLFSVQWQIWQDWAPGYHFVNTVLHIANAILIFFILSTLFSNKADKSARYIWLAFLTALVFLIHPLQTEAVTYVSGLADVLSTFFTFLGIIFYFRFRDTPTKWKYYTLTIGAYLLAILSKDTAVIMPATLAITDFFFLPQSLSIKQRLIKIVKSIWPFFIIAGLYLLLRATALNFAQISFIAPDFFTRALIFFRVLLVYLGLIFWPNNLHMERSVEIPNGFEIDVLFGALLTITLIAAAILSIKRYPVVSFGVLWFFARLFPNSNLVFPNAGLIYEHWMYMPMIGIWLVVFWLLLKKMNVAEGFSLPKWRTKVLRYTLIVLFAAYCLLLSTKTIARNNDWDNPIRFYNQTLKYAPNSYRLINNLGMSYAEAEDHKNAKQRYEKAISLNPNNPVAHHNLGNTYKELGEKEQAIAEFRKAIELDPKFVFSYNALAKLYLEEGDKDKAQKVIKEYYLSQENPRPK